MGLSQSEFGGKLNTSAMAVSRWERGIQEPPAQIYIQLGILVGDPRCWNFWERAGLRNMDLMRVLPALRKGLGKSAPGMLPVVHAGAGQRQEQSKSSMTVIPLLPVRAGTPGFAGDKILHLSKITAEASVAVPKSWCPHAAFTNCIRIAGTSMAPLILDGEIVAVDAYETDRFQLNGKVVLAWHKDRGLLVARLRTFDHTDVLVAENSEVEGICLGPNNDWTIAGKVLWWLGWAP
jgi:SOS-response transcriptional repressor LexA